MRPPFARARSVGNPVPYSGTPVTIVSGQALRDDRTSAPPLTCGGTECRSATGTRSTVVTLVRKRDRPRGRPLRSLRSAAGGAVPAPHLGLHPGTAIQDVVQRLCHYGRGGVVGGYPPAACAYQCSLRLLAGSHARIIDRRENRAIVNGNSVGIVVFRFEILHCFHGGMHWFPRGIRFGG